MDKDTRESLWQLWTRTDYVEKNYPEVAKKYRKGWIADFADFMQKKYPSLIEEFVYASPYLGGVDCKKPKKSKKSKKSGKLGDFHRIEDYTDDMAARELAKQTGLSIKDAKNAIAVYWESIKKNLRNYQEVKIRGVGSFKRAVVSFYDNFNTGKKKSSNSVKFTMSATFKKDCTKR